MEFTLQPVAETVSVFDYIELVVTSSEPLPAGMNPFTHVFVDCTFSHVENEGRGRYVSGFCDADDGSRYIVRFMPQTPGQWVYRFHISIDGTAYEAPPGKFVAHDAGRRGLVEIDPDEPFHFRWSGTGEHFHYNGTTAYSLLALSETLMEHALDRLHRLGVNRLRVTLSLRVPSGREWAENVDATPDFTFRLNPWQAARPESVSDPGWDVTRYNVGFWQKAERMLRLCRDRDMIVSIIFYTDGRRPGVYPFRETWENGDRKLEEHYYQYAINRFGAFSNVMWDVTNEWALFRDENWVRTMGGYLQSQDLYGHLISVHGHGDFKYRAEPWADFALFQSWDEHGGNAYMLRNRQEQNETGHAIPQVNEEYGYEDHYPTGWGEGRVAPSRNADSRRRLAWEIALAGGYQTTGERPLSFTDKTATTSPVAGWMNGLGADDSTEMLDGNRRIVSFFAPLDFRRFTPANERVTCDKPAFCTADAGRAVVVYLDDGSASASVELEAGAWTARWFDPLTGEYADAGRATHRGGAFLLPPCPTPDHDSVLLLQRLD